MTDNDRFFIGWAVTECAKKGVRVLLESKKSVIADGIKCSGYFDEVKKELRVACNKPQKNWFPIFVHEFCHFEQWKEKDRSFLDVSENYSNNNTIWEWLDGKNFKYNNIKQSVRSYQRLELDCEKRAVKHIDNFNLSIEKERYIKQANIYILFYSLVLKNRKWYKNQPYEDKNILNVISSTFIKSFTSLPKGYEDSVIKVNFN